MRKSVFALVALVASTFVVPAYAGVTAIVDISSQSMTVKENGRTKYTWAVSTARKGYRTPVGSYTAQRLERTWFSRTYDMAPMPHSIFFVGGYAIHGTTETGRLGHPASHGCVRLAPDNAAALFSLARKHGRQNTRVIVQQ